MSILILLFTSLPRDNFFSDEPHYCGKGVESRSGLVRIREDRPRSNPKPNYDPISGFICINPRPIRVRKPVRILLCHFVKLGRQGRSRFTKWDFDGWVPD